MTDFTDMNMPFEDVPDGPIVLPMGDMIICGGVGYRSAVLPPSTLCPDPTPVLIFDFNTAEGGRLPPIALILDDGPLLALSDQIRKAVRSARRAAGR